jgi:hypothetical protein
MIYEIQTTVSIVSDPDDPNCHWTCWGADDDPVRLLREFVEAVNDDNIDTTESYWRLVIEP